MNKTRKRKIGLDIFLIGVLGLFSCLALTGMFGDLVALAEEASPVPGMRSPVRIAFLPNGNLLVSDKSAGAILTVSRKDLQAVRSFRVPGKPLGVAYSRGLVYVGNETTKRVEVYDRDGLALFNLGGEGEVVGQPTDIALDPGTAEVFVLDGAEKVVLVYSTAGPFLRTIPSTFPDTNQLSSPTGIAVDPLRREVLVSDYGDPLSWGKYPAIHIYSYEGVYLGKISGKLGMMGTRFSRPQGLVVDEMSNIFLIDCYSSEILVFNRETSSHLKTLGGFGLEEGQLQLPLDLVMDKRTKDIYVTNNRPARIEVFRGGGLLP